MSKKKSVPELLAPAGSPEALYAAAAAGADAVYLSGQNFGARRFAVNFDKNGLREAIDFCHARGMKVYVTLNTLISDAEMKDALAEMLWYYECGADAVLVQDLGLMHAASECIPGLNLHASTQMTITNSAGAAAAAENGIKRIVLAREVPLENAAAIMKKTHSGAASEDAAPAAELEVFVHGALCCSYSGQCLFSSMLGGRSGNRGMCAQPCRKKYTLVECTPDRYMRCSQFRKLKTSGPYLLSFRDLCTYEKLKEISDAGIASLKIEGRMKSAEYVAVVAGIYRKALDRFASNCSASPEDAEKEIETLLSAYNRRFTDGWLFKAKGAAMMSYDKPDNRGLYLGTVIENDKFKQTCRIKTETEFRVFSGDGLTVKRRGESRDDGFLIRNQFSLKGGVLTVKARTTAREGDKVFITRRADTEALAKEIIERDGKIAAKIPITVVFSVGDDLMPVISGNYTLRHREYAFTYKSPEKLAYAENKPLTSADIEKIFSKCGGTQFVMKSFRYEGEEKYFLPASTLNLIRRDFLKSAENAAVMSFRPPESDVKSAGAKVAALMTETVMKPMQRPEKKPLKVCVIADSPECVKGAVEGGCGCVCYEPDINPENRNAGEELAAKLTAAAKMMHGYAAELVWKLPHIVSEQELEFICKNLDTAVKCGISGIMTDNYGTAHAIHCLNPDIKLFGAPGLNIYNSLSAAFVSDIFAGAVLSEEADADGIRKLIAVLPENIRGRFEAGYMVSGAAELMVVKNDLIKPPCAKGQLSSDKGVFYGIMDAKERIFPIYTDSCGRTHIFNSVETCLIDDLAEIADAGISDIFIDARHKTCDYASAVSKAYTKAAGLVMQDKASPQALEEYKKSISEVSAGGITKAHFRRGV